ncbi:MAG TPA: hypothetical protein VFF65_09080 [Phycisphaerales bacterium]|nr:hypothetical protein [Phycisphaerales bacterium]
MSTITAEFNTALVEAHLAAVKALTDLIRTSTDRTELRRLIAVVARFRHRPAANEDDSPGPDRAPPPHRSGRDEPADLPEADTRPRIPPLATASNGSTRTPRSLILAAASALSLCAPITPATGTG